MFTLAMLTLVMLIFLIIALSGLFFDRNNGDVNDEAVEDLDPET